MKTNFKKNILQLCTINKDASFVSKEDWTSDEINNEKYDIEFFDVAEVKETGYDKNFPSDLFFTIVLENGNVLNVGGQWYDDDTIMISYTDK